MDILAVNPQVIEQFRAGQEIEGMHRDRLLLLTTTGEKSGELRTSPMMFHPEDGRMLVVAANMGSDDHPHWYRNLVASPSVTVEVADERFDATAVALEGDDREREWAMLKETYPFFADYETKTERQIPVVSLVRVPTAA
ncbi:nitroreductase/quinone reductase family protein [Glaciihabitans sp. UYNi722]|uniref:nitroreductase/quinone reductase family protein n=1 Tax=Glaciihabitans sp. UYNi722 TaxID=3156344 RepID=UPI00339B847E